MDCTARGKGNERVEGVTMVLVDQTVVMMMTITWMEVVLWKFGRRREKCSKRGEEQSMEIPYK